ncbi:ATP-binding protein [Tateyamaria sp.]|uniref:ATP-binding protein n=1 Tax=Tateyamaria sp. TaxID=1929288 RepID=UPI00329AC75D
MSFRLKTVLGIAIIELMVMAILIAVNQFALGGSATTQLFQRAESTGRLFSDAVADAVIATDLATLDATIGTAVSNADLTYVRVKNSSGVVLSQGGASEALSVPFQRDQNFDTARDDHVIDIDLPVMIDGVSYGTIELGISTLTVEEEIAQALHWNLVVALAGMSLVAVFGYGLGSILTRELHWLREGALKISKGDLESRIRVRGNDELAETARYFNHMAQALANDRATLQTQQDELLAKKARVEVIVDCMTDISGGGDAAHVPDTDRPDEIGDMARATVIFDNSMREVRKARLEQQRLISAFDQVAEQVAIFGLEGNVLFLNAAFKEFNRAVLDALPQQFTLQDFLQEGVAQDAFPDAKSSPEEWISNQLYRSNSTPREIKRSPDRILLTVQSHVEGIGVVLSAKDITELRQSERKLIQASKMATLGEMATGIAHELNQPLGVIRMAASNCVKRIGKGQCDPDYMAGKLTRIGEQTKRASLIIDHMRVFGRKADGNPVPFDLRESLEQISTLARAQLQTLDISLSVSIPNSSAIVMGERVIFEQVLLNLISNARDAIEMQGTGSGEISVAADFGRADGHSITIQDTGGGVPEDVLERLFEPFFTTKEPGKGTGLGLSISFGTIQEMSGTISVQNTKQGACFTIQLPDAGS